MGMINPHLPRDESPVFLCLEHGDDKPSLTQR
jgi:hypothetical protein